MPSMQEVRYTRISGTELTEEQIARIEASREFEDEYDEDCPEIDPVKTPELFEALLKATAKRNKRVEKLLKEFA